MSEKIDLDHYDEKICSVLFDHPGGLGFNDLLRKTEFNKKTFNNHLDHLVRNEIIKKEKLFSYHGGATRYTLLIDEGRRKSIEHVVEEGKNVIEYTKKLSKVKQYEITPFVLQGIANTFLLSIVQYLTDPQGKILYQIFLNKLEELLDEYKAYINKNFSKKAIQTIFLTSSVVVYPFQNAVIATIGGDIEASNINKQRTFEDVLKHMLSYDRKKVYQNIEVVLSHFGDAKEILKKSPKELEQVFIDYVLQQNLLKNKKS